MVILNENLQQKLKLLSELPESKYPFISLYLHINAQEFLSQAEKNRIFIKNSFQKLEKPNINIEKDREKILDFLENKVPTKAHGLAIFACNQLGVFEVFFSIMPFDNSFTVNSIPHLKQLACHADECENALLILTDKRYARIFNIEIGGFVKDEADMEHEIHRFHKQGGWAQMRYQRHIKNMEMHHYKEVAKVAAEFLENNPYKNLILIGQHHEIINFQEHLPKRVKTKIIDINSFSTNGMRANINSILQTVIEDLRSNELKKDANKVSEVINKLPRYAATGWQDIIQLVEEGRVQELIIPGHKSYIGWKCNGCLYVEKNQHQAGCKECNNGLRKTDLAEEIIRLVFKNNGKVDLIKEEASHELEKHEGIGAVVRY